ncbi:MAG TPA: cysteine dioxygenase family protein [Pyrinomonadaceae bacterium]|nr:cysteine dioxygenase family protein [Pyrinomonadaceae bacterium]
MKPFHLTHFDAAAIRLPIVQAIEATEPKPADSDFRLTFQALAEALKSMTAVPALADVYRLVEGTDMSREEVAPYLGFKAGNYSRHRVMKNDFVEMLVLCWKPGQRTPIHDHNGSHGAVFVHKGIMWETIFEYDTEKGLQYASHRELRAGGLTGSEIPDIHQLGNPDVSGRDLVTIHIYAPPLGVLKTYKLGSSTIESYTPAEPDFV